MTARRAAAREARAGDRIRNAALTWPGVEGHPHRFGGTEYRLGRREIGHVHGDELVDVPFPRRIREKLVAEGRALPHHVLPDSGWISFFIRSDADVSRAIELLRMSYDLARTQREKKGSGATASP
ncbi:MAG TPA: luciferase family protein [Anaerolineales bacterium]|nr:luciferase family protein [Anaerolineales bacterium]